MPLEITVYLDGLSLLSLPHLSCNKALILHFPEASKARRRGPVIEDKKKEENKEDPKP